MPFLNRTLLKKYSLFTGFIVFSAIYEHISSWLSINFNTLRTTGINTDKFLLSSLLKHDIVFLAVCSTAFIFIPVLLVKWIKKNSIHVKDSFSRRFFRIPIITLFVVSMAVQVFFLLNVNKGFSLSGDENAYLFQAKIFSQGFLTVPSHPLKEFFNNDHIVNNGRMFAIYPPGVPFLLYLGMLLSAPWLVGPLFASASLVLFYVIFCRHNPPHIAFLAACSIALSRFFITFGASYHSHPPALFFTVLAIFLYEKLESCGRGSIYFGAVLGMAFIIRPFTAVLLAFVLMFELVFKLLSTKQQTGNISNVLRLKSITTAAAGFLPFFAVFCAYNYHLTGNMLKMGYLVSDDIQFIGLQGNLIFGLKSILYACWRLFDGLFAIPTPVGLFLTALGVYKAGKDGRRYFFIFLTTVAVCSTMRFYQFRYFYSFAFFLHIYVFIGFEAFIALFIKYKKRTGIVHSQWLMSVSVVFAILTLSKSVRVKKRWLEKVTTPYRLVKKEGLKNSIVFLGSTSYVYPMFYSRNSPKLNDTVLYVLDLGNKNKKLIKYYGGRRRCFIYERGMLKHLI